MNFTKSKMMKAISLIAAFLAVFSLVNMGFEMELVKQWRMDGESTKVAIFMATRFLIMGVLAAITWVSYSIGETLEQREMELEEISEF